MMDSDSDDSSDTEEDEDEDRDRQRSKSLPQQFNLGRFCSMRVLTFHRFCHWEVRARNSSTPADRPQLHSSITSTKLFIPK